MKLFSKRHVERRIGPESLRYKRIARTNELLSFEARNRLIAQLRFLSSRDDYLEWHILFADERNKPPYITFDEDKLDDFSQIELGYRLTETFDFHNLTMQKSKQSIKYASDDTPYEEFYDDYRLFDMAEITILFAKKDKRPEVIERIGSILKEENTDYEIVEHLITRKRGDDLKAIMGILKDENLKRKLERFFDYYSKKDYLNASKISADIVNIIFSDEDKSAKKVVIQNIEHKLSKQLVEGTKSKQDKIESHIDSVLKIARNLNNDIYDIRHTEKSTLKPKGDNLYKLVARHNLSIIELALTALKDDFVLSDDWENIKAEYVEKYKIDTNVRRVRKPRDEPINLDDIPF